MDGNDAKQCLFRFISSFSSSAKYSPSFNSRAISDLIEAV